MIVFYQFRVQLVKHHVKNSVCVGVVTDHTIQNRKRCQIEKSLILGRPTSRPCGHLRILMPYDSPSRNCFKNKLSEMSEPDSKIADISEKIVKLFKVTLSGSKKHSKKSFEMAKKQKK